MSGELCPDLNFVDLPFTFWSESLERSTINLSVLIFPGIANFRVRDVSLDDGIEQLEVQSYKVSKAGKLNIEFNKDLEIDEKYLSLLQQELRGRKLNNETDGSLNINLEDIIYFQIEDGDEDDEFVNKRIHNVTLDSITGNYLNSTIYFEVPHDISADITEPDVLNFYFLRSSMFVDSETSEPLQDFSVYKVELGPQLSEEEMEEYE